MKKVETVEKQGRGRPKKKDTRKPRTIWMNDQEYKALSKKSKEANIDFSKYCREILLRKNPTFYGDGYKAIFNEIHKQGVNLNQAVKSLNELSITHELSRSPDAFAETIMKNQSEILHYLKSILENDRQDS
ncbi:MAG: hypothetical protein RLO17_24785 [Cyclobacteriaceae bacterium]|jgi:hypothetical protein|tara:strand:+ start:3544 stop:3936 length:393 start_codon:yes stop_codon:yes gene_type:complete